MDGELLINLIQHVGYDPRRAYSGRGMFGKECVGLTTENSFANTIADLVEGCSNLEEAAELVRGARSDNLGLSTVIYWPDVQATAER